MAGKMTGLVTWTSPTSLGGGSFVDLSGARNAPQSRPDTRPRAIAEVSDFIKKSGFEVPVFDNLFMKLISQDLPKLRIGTQLKIKLPNSYAVVNDTD